MLRCFWVGLSRRPALLRSAVHAASTLLPHQGRNLTARQTNAEEGHFSKKRDFAPSKRMCAGGEIALFAKLRHRTLSENPHIPDEKIDT